MGTHHVGSNARTVSAGLAHGSVRAGVSRTLVTSLRLSKQQVALVYIRK